MPAPELGTKQVCPTCQSKFYDLSRRPAHCPKCGADFDPEEALKSRRVVRGRGAAYEDDKVEDQVKPDAEEAEEEEEEATPEIDEAADEPVVLDDDEEGDGTPAPAEDLGVDLEEEAEAEDAEDVPFLEDEEEDEFPDDDIEGLPEEGDAEDR